jgi:hypothetical protein
MAATLSNCAAASRVGIGNQSPWPMRRSLADTPATALWPMITRW